MSRIIRENRDEEADLNARRALVDATKAELGDRKVVGPYYPRDLMAGDPASPGGTKVTSAETDGSIPGGSAAAGVQDIGSLANIAEADREDKQTRLVEDEGAIYRFDANSVDPANPPYVVAPTVGNGRWFRTPPAGLANGFASLGATGRLLDSQIPLSGLEQFSTGRVTFDGFTRLGGLTLRVGAGRGYFKDGPPLDAPPAVVNAVSWAQTDIVLPANATRYISVDPAGVVSAQPAPVPTEENIILGSVITNGADIEFLSFVDVDLIQPISDLHRFLASAVGPLAVDGLFVTERTPPSLQVDVAAGTYYIAKDRKTFAGVSPATFRYWYRTAGGGPPPFTVVSAVGAIDPNNYDGGAGLAAIPAGRWKKDLVFLAPIDDVGGGEIHVVYGQETFATQADAETGGLPDLPSLFYTEAIRLAGVVVQQGAADITSIVNLQPRLGQLAPPLIIDDDLSQDIVSDSALATTTSLVDVLMPGMSITPQAGTYLVWHNSDVTDVTNNTDLWVSIYSGGVLAPNSERVTRVSQGARRRVTGTMARVVVNGAQAIETRWRVSGGTGEARGRSMMILKVA